jgi:hypothetical protein
MDKFFLDNITIRVFIEQPPKTNKYNFIANNQFI